MVRNSDYPEGKRKRDLETAAHAVFELFENRVLPFDSLAAREFAAIVANRRSLGLPMKTSMHRSPPLHAHIACRLRPETLKYLAQTGVQILDPWRL